MFSCGTDQIYSVLLSVICWQAESCLAVLVPYNDKSVLDLLVLPFYFWEWNIVVGTVPGLQSEISKSRGYFREDQEINLYLECLDRLRFPPTLLLNGYLELFWEVKRRQVVKINTNSIHYCAKNKWKCNSLPPYAFMVCTKTKLSLSSPYFHSYLQLLF